MSDNINVEQLKEFLEFRIKKVEEKVDDIPVKIDIMHLEHTTSDEAQSLAIQSIGDKVNLMWKAIGTVAVILLGSIIKYVVGT